MTLRKAQTEARELGFQLRWSAGWGEYRLAPLDVESWRSEQYAYYTPDLDDALGTARFEAKRRKGEL